jgi:hypothetical protein
MANLRDTEAVTRFRNILREQQPFLAERYHVASLGLFGSYLRGTQRPDSDLDVLVTFHKFPGLFQFIELEIYLSDLLGVKVDLVIKESLKPHIGRRVLEEVVQV